MKVKLILLFVFIFCLQAFSQDDDKGYQTYTVRFGEWMSDTSMVATCQVLIVGREIHVYNDGSLSGEKGEQIAWGFVCKHNETGATIICVHPHDVDASEIGGCSDGPIVIDLERQIIWLC